MIKYIKLKNIGSYSEAILEPTIAIEKNKAIETKIAENVLIYGLNGSGKSIMSNFLRSKNTAFANLNSQDFSACELSGFDENNEKILVYNQGFIDDTFREVDEKGLRGIFTLVPDGENKNILDNIKKLEEENQYLQQKNETNTGDIKKENSEFNQINEKFEDKIWSIVGNYKDYEQGIFKYCLVGFMGSKEILKEEILKIQTKAEFFTLDVCENKLKSFKKLNSGEVNDIQPILLDNIEIIEQDEIFAKNIVGNENSSVSALIKELNNSDWVKKGQEYLKFSNNLCPFCQQETITQDFKIQLQEYFNESYQKDINALKERLNQYEQYLQGLPDIQNFLSNYFVKEKEERKEKFERLYQELKNTIQNNINLIKNKIQEPSRIIKLENSKNSLVNLNSLISEIQNNIKTYKEEKANENKMKEKIKESFWINMYNKYKVEIEEYQKNKKQHDEKISNLANNISANKEKIKENNTSITEEKEKLSSVEHTIKAINASLESIGIKSFRIEKYGDNFYQIVRENNKAVFNTLSEGEKGIISFLYFIELCKGKENKDEIDKNKIIVIDDPVSSLSHNHLFNVAQLIKRHFLIKKENSVKVSQVFILTHNLYFFHELIHNITPTGKPKNTLLYKISKEEYSRIEKIQRQDIANEYESYWNIVKKFNGDDEINRDKYRHIIPNVMRNILEHFFAFVGRKKYDKYIEEFDKLTANAFIRFIKRESHSDSANIIDFKEIGNQEIIDNFRNIFKHTGNEDHYKKYMGEQ
ncbi:hypothetical protein CQA38_05750 [Campylobacter sp. MIT 12-5580]|uniref:AAA family ATPase n=1 Tax=Campylobacter sp. MIT 12-5580 TaxID=2040651 RepID=UPI0010F634B1|nr:AAA family ATPase [Campylobacter sp. MIT 12-5580]TKX29064.1 hypothetical protein CQA38_05750 [Campylobacter sp. MIT 12-5580]